MKIQEALSKVKALKSDAIRLISEAAEKKERIIYIDINDKYYTSKVETIDSIIEEALSKLAYAHEIKLAIQKANALTGIADLIQERDFMKILCQQLLQFIRVPPETDPMLERQSAFTASSSTAVFLKKTATFNTEDINRVYNFAVDRIRNIDMEIQQKNWEVDIDELISQKFMSLLDQITS
jgi:hypothetical protein